MSEMPVGPEPATMSNSEPDTGTPDISVSAQQPTISAGELSRFIHNYDRFLAQYIASNLLHHFDLTPKTDTAKAAYVPIPADGVSDLLVRLRDYLSMHRVGDSHYKLWEEIGATLDRRSPAGIEKLPMWQQVQFGLLMGKLSDWRNADHEDAITICRSDIIAIIEGVKALQSASVPSTVLPGSTEAGK